MGDGAEVWYIMQIIILKLAGTWDKQLFSVLFPPQPHQDILEMTVACSWEDISSDWSALLAGSNM